MGVAGLGPPHGGGALPHGVGGNPPGAEAPHHPVPKRPDLDNVVKLVADALNGMAWTDDAYCQGLEASKAYGPAAQVVLEWWPVPDAGRWA